MIRTIKSCLYKTIGRSRIRYFDLLTVISDVQSAINQRPLICRCSSDSDLEVITPNCFLRPNANLGLVLKLDNQDIWESDTPSRLNVVLELKIVSFHNTINYLTTQINNETSFETQQRKLYYFSRSKRVRERKCFFGCRRLVCCSLSL